MPAIHFIGGEKGGVGKSVLSRVLAQYCIDQAIPFIGYDTDRSHASFQRFYGAYAAHTVIDDYASLDQVAEASTAEPRREILVDLAAQTFAPLSRWIVDSGVLDVLTEAGVPVRFWHVMDDSKDSLAMLGTLFETFGGTVSYVVVLNHGRGRDFKAFQESVLKSTALSFGAKIVELRALHEASMRKIDHFDASFWAAVNQRSGDHALGLFERQRVKVWLAKTYEDVAPIIGPAATP